MMTGQQRQRSQARQTADEAAVLHVDESTTPDEREELAITGEPRLSFNLAMSKAKLESRRVNELAPSCRSILRGVKAAPAQSSLRAGPKGRLEMSAKTQRLNQLLSMSFDILTYMISDVKSKTRANK